MSLAAVLVTALVAAAPADARSDGRNKRVLFIHGWVTDRTSHWPVRRADLAAAFRSY
jgi:hypothetical protein